MVHPTLMCVKIYDIIHNAEVPNDVLTKEGGVPRHVM